jgi:hypothetical protein
MVVEDTTTYNYNASLPRLPRQQDHPGAPRKPLRRAAKCGQGGDHGRKREHPISAHCTHARWPGFFLMTDGRVDARCAFCAPVGPRRRAREVVGATEAVFISYIYIYIFLFMHCFFFKYILFYLLAETV